MSKVGIATLPLHNSKAPRWLLSRMLKLGKPIVDIIYDMEGAEGIIRRLSDTYWFQGLACVLGFDWHSSGCTTVLGGVLKQIITPQDHGLILAGGKGKHARKVKEHLSERAKILDFNEENIEQLVNVSRLVAKVDNAALQDGFSLYHHLMIVSEENWGIVQQGLDTTIKKARRYHWCSDGLTTYINNPHKDITTEVYKNKVLDMVSSKSQECRKTSIDLIQEGPQKIQRYLNKLRDRAQTSLYDFTMPEKSIKLRKVPHLNMPIPFTLKWESLEAAKQIGVVDYTDLLGIKGIGKGMIRALALISELIWGESPSWKDPAKYSFAVGGKDGIPYPVNLKRMESCAQILKEAINMARLEQKEKLQALKSLHKFINRKSIL
ncbi:MAG: hypothetical protein BAJALOKI1v1_1270008 [Promethearchaeota archaeon]|nr:MAG: hypothetical protein BAJALOKI1v1_1270008 [Candidatus Lokiarchaeota archaeon]